MSDAEFRWTVTSSAKHVATCFSQQLARGNSPPPSPIGFMSVTVFPVRLLAVSFLMLLAWPFAFAASLGRSEYVVEPQSWWRRCAPSQAQNIYSSHLVWVSFDQF
uniref:Uncharacterized protein n=1 Tax=Hippocampus comes TaxID=109280 RepID=A0A3Q2Z8L3_HIPCM